MLFPVSGVEVNPLVPPLIALAVSAFTSLGGISGAFLLLPYQVSVLGFSGPAVSPTNLVYNIVAIPSGVYRYIREGRMNWPVAAVIIAGTLPGLYFGAVIRIGWLPDPVRFRLFVGCVLLYIGFRLLYEQIPWAMRKKDRILDFEAGVQERLQAVLKEAGANAGRSLPPAARIKLVSWSPRKVSYSFLEETFTFHAPGVFSLALVVGLIGGTYGIGGGAIIAPFLVTIFKLPVHTIGGATLLSTLVTSVAGVSIYFALGITPDLLLGASFGIGGCLGMYIGARLQKHVSGKAVRIGLGVIISGLASHAIAGFFMR